MFNNDCAFPPATASKAEQLLYEMFGMNPGEQRPTVANNNSNETAAFCILNNNSDADDALPPAPACWGVDQLIMQQALAMILGPVPGDDNTNNCNIKCGAVAAAPRRVVHHSHHNHSHSHSHGHHSAGSGSDTPTSGRSVSHIGIACDECRAKKIRCAGGDPCAQCEARGVKCERSRTSRYSVRRTLTKKKKAKAKPAPVVLPSASRQSSSDHEEAAAAGARAAAAALAAMRVGEL